MNEKMCKNPPTFNPRVEYEKFLQEAEKRAKNRVFEEKKCSYIYRGYGIEYDYNPKNRTSNSEYGFFPPDVFSTPKRNFFKPQTFSNAAIRFGMYRNYSLNYTR